MAFSMAEREIAQAIKKGEVAEEEDRVQLPGLSLDKFVGMPPIPDLAQAPLAPGAAYATLDEVENIV
jgi:hypothetical protein